MFTTLLYQFLFFISFVSAAFVHPGLMATSNDISRIKTKLAEKKYPWTSSYAVLTKMRFADPTYTNGAVSNLTRANNTDLLWHDAAAAFALALRWKVEGDDDCAAAAAKILTAWGEKLESLGTDSDSFLTAGLQGFELANAGELLRDYAPFVANGQKAYTDMMVNIFLAKNIIFIKHEFWSEAVHNHFFASWELCNMASAMAIAILTDDQDTFDFVLDYWHTGDGNGAIAHAISDIVEEPVTGKPLGQGQEEGRDQGHAAIDPDRHAAIAQMAWNQGTDLYADSDYRMLRGAEYFARFNLGYDVPFVPYANVICNFTEASIASRGKVKPSWELLYSHYGQILGMDVPWIKAYLNYSLPTFIGHNNTEGGLGSFGEGAGHYDSLGWGSLLHHLDDEDVAAAKSNIAVAVSSSVSSNTTSSVSSATASSVTSATTSFVSSITTSATYSVPVTSVSSIPTTFISSFSASSVTSTIPSSPTTAEPLPTHTVTPNPSVVYVFGCKDNK